MQYVHPLTIEKFNDKDVQVVYDYEPPENATGYNGRFTIESINYWNTELKDFFNEAEMEQIEEAIKAGEDYLHY